MDLNNKVALITGGRRIGRHLAARLAERGMHIAISYHSSREIAEATVRECAAHGVSAETFSVDLREPEQAEQLVAEVAARWGRLDVLVNLTSTFQRTPLSTLTHEQFRLGIADNLSAPYWVAVAAARQMLQQPIEAGLQGKILHFTDWAVDRPYRDFLPYLIAKGGLVTLTKALAIELAPTITVNAIAPGTVAPPPHATPEQLTRIRESSLLGRIGSPDDVVRAVLYLLEGTDFVTGEVFRVDGGRFLGVPTERPHNP